jgi:hypothetical protein
MFHTGWANKVSRLSTVQALEPPNRVVQIFPYEVCVRKAHSKFETLYTCVRSSDVSTGGRSLGSERDDSKTFPIPNRPPYQET